MSNAHDTFVREDLALDMVKSEKILHETGLLLAFDLPVIFEKPN